MIILSWDLAPIPRENDLLSNDGMIDGKPGAILRKWADIRKVVGTIPKEQKPGMKFKTLSAENVVDKVREAADAEGVLIFPVAIVGSGYVVEDGTLATVTQTFRVQALEDGSYIEIAGFGLGADSQDKAGGKAGTYAMKAALAQALLANGSAKKGGIKAPDTDDEDEPIKGGVRPVKAKRLPADATENVKAAFDLAQTPEDYKAAVGLVKMLTPEAQLSLMDTVKAAKARCIAVG